MRHLSALGLLQFLTRVLYGLLQPLDALLIADIIALITIAHLPAGLQIFLCLRQFFLRALYIVLLAVGGGCCRDRFCAAGGRRRGGAVNAGRA